MRHFIAACHLDHWTAWEASHPEAGFGGDTRAYALRRLFDSLGLDPTSIETGDEQRNHTFIVRDKPCPDCGGSGKYVGLNSVEPCKGCGGSRRV